MVLRKFSLVVAMVIAVAGSARAQFTIPTVDSGSKVSIRPLADTIKGITITNNYFSRALWNAQLKALRRQRNTMEFNANLAASQTQFVNWQAGGDNTFSGRSTIMFHHVYQRTRFGLDYRFDARYGMTYINKKMFKNEDEFKINIQTAWKIEHNWSYAAAINLRSQFTNGYRSRTDHTRISDIMAPGYIDLSIGFNWKKAGSPWNISLSPLTGSVITVLDDELKAMGIAGVPKGQSTKGQMGPSVRIYFDKTFGKKVFRYYSNFYSFCNIKTPPTVRWENSLEIKATKVLSTKIYGLFYYDKYSGTTKPQYNYSISVGLSYWLKNK